MAWMRATQKRGAVGLSCMPGCQLLLGTNTKAPTAGTTGGTGTLMTIPVSGGSREEGEAAE